MARLYPRSGKAIEFLSKFRPNGPWLLLGIVPDPVGEQPGENVIRMPSFQPRVVNVKARTLDVLTDDEHGTPNCADFIEQYNNVNSTDHVRNIYFGVNPTRMPMDDKPTKEDIAQAEYLHVDADPKKDETPAQFKERILALVAAFDKEPRFVVDSGNGIHLYWRLKVPVVLDGEEAIADIEARNAALALAFGADPSTRNVDRIMRLPGSVNFPNQKKRDLGREPVLAALLEANDVSYDVTEFAKADVPSSNKPSSRSKRQRKPRADGHHVDRLQDVIRHGRYEQFDEDRSRAVFYVTNEMLRRGHYQDAIVRVLTNNENAVAKHVLEQSNPTEYAEKQVRHAIDHEDAFAREAAEKGKKGRIAYHAGNIRIALLKMGISVRYDRFADRLLLDGLDGFGPTLDDAATRRIKFMLEQWFHFQPTLALLQDVLADTAQMNAFHPVVDYLASVQPRWDGRPRLDRWLVTYAGAEDNEYTRAVGALILLAAVRRVRQPGCKFDEMLVLEFPPQGAAEKSTALGVLSVREEDWFSDSFSLHHRGKEIIEMLRGRWIIECPELVGIRGAEVEHVKAVLSRRVDRGRPAYGHFVVEAPRQCVFFGTTNDARYFFDQTGNRRFWPVAIGRFDLEGLRRDLHQLWAEAAVREAAGESIRLKEELWPVAAKEQALRLVVDPFEQALRDHLGDVERAKIASEAVWTILNIQPGQRTMAHQQRMGDAMRRLGWRKNEAGQVRIDGRNVTGYVIGRPPWEAVTAFREKGGELFVAVRPTSPRKLRVVREEQNEPDD